MRALVIADLLASAVLSPQMQPAHPLQQAAQNLAVGRLGEQHQRHHVVDHQAGRQLTVALALLARLAQHGIDQVPRDRRGQHSQGDIVADPWAVRQARHCPDHQRILPSTEHPEIQLSQTP